MKKIEPLLLLLMNYIYCNKFYRLFEIKLEWYNDNL